MKSKIREILREYVQSIDELDETKHYDDRIVQRFLSQNSLDVIYAKPGGPKGFYTDYPYGVVGNYIVSQDLKSVIELRMKKIMQLEFDENSSVGIIIKRFDLDALDCNIVREDPSQRERYYDIMKTTDSERGGRNVIYLRDTPTRSMGDMLFLIVKGNNIVTLIFERSYLYDKGELEYKKGLDEVLTYDQVLERLSQR